MLLDDRLQGDDHWIATGLRSRGFSVAVLDIPGYSPDNRLVRARRGILAAQYVRLALRGLRLASRANAIILSTNFQVGALTAALATAGSVPIPGVLALNAIIRGKDPVVARVRACAYRLAQRQPGFRLTVNSEENALRYQREFGFDPLRVSVVGDPWAPHYPRESTDDREAGTVFCGGEVARDWETFFGVARDNGDVPFAGVASSGNWAPALPVPENVTMEFDLAEEEFYRRVLGARLVLLPLQGTVTAGLIVLIRSVLLGRLVLATRTPAIERYYPAEYSELLAAPGDVAGLSALVRRFWAATEERHATIAAVREHILSRMSPEAYLDSLSSLLRASPA
jgi:hypothetical protein